MKKALFPLLTVFLAVFAALLIVEAGLRIGSQSVPYFNILNAFHRGDKELGWVLAPSFSARFKRDDFDAVISTDEKGFRKIESKIQPAAGAAPVMFVGDSFLWGWGVSQGKVFTDVLQDELGPGFRIINRGVTKYGTVQENILLKKQMPVEKPALVGLVFFYNDFSDNTDAGMLRRPYCTVEGDRVILNNYPAASPALGGAFRQIRRYSYTASFLAYFWDSSAAPYFKRIIKEGARAAKTETAKTRGVSVQAVETRGAPVGTVEARAVPDRARENEKTGNSPAGGIGETPVQPVLINGKIHTLSIADIRIMEHNLAEMKATCESQGAGFFVVYAPDAGELVSTGESAYLIGMKQICARLGIDLLVPMEAMRAAREIGPNGEPFYFPHDLHWTARAHHLAATLIRDYVRTLYPEQAASGSGTGGKTGN